MITIKSEGSTDIMDYVLSCSQIPLSCARNRDGTHKIGEFNMTVSESLSSTYRVEGADIEVYTLGTTYPSFVGQIVKSEYISDSRIYRLLIRDNLRYLTEKYITSGNLAAAFESGSGIEYWTTETINNLSSVQVLWAIEKMFVDSNIPAANGFAYATNYELKVIDTVIIGTAYDILFKDVRVDDYMLWCINQSAATYPNNINDNQYNTQRLTYWDFISYWLALTKSHIYLSASGTAKQYRIATIPTSPAVPYDDDKVFSQKSKRIIGNNEGWTANHQFNSNRSTFRTATVDSVSSHRFTSGEEHASITLYSNLVFMYDNPAQAGDNMLWGLTTDNGNYAAGKCQTGNDMAQPKANALELNFDSLERRSVLTQKNANFKENFALVKEQQIKTIYET